MKKFLIFSLLSILSLSACSEWSSVQYENAYKSKPGAKLLSTQNHHENTQYFKTYMQPAYQSPVNRKSNALEIVQKEATKNEQQKRQAQSEKAKQKILKNE